ncbi:hypothetical protein LQF76_03880 [Gloeomargaritales cyanobacterium VI4D9]|nr:hypothetical protein LQF76_03880 [Gloeomargaritales cyanobacterium VI4D9]
MSSQTSVQQGGAVSEHGGTDAHAAQHSAPGVGMLKSDHTGNPIAHELELV